MGKVKIQDPAEFHAWTQSTHCTMKNVDFIFVSSEECTRKAEELGRVVIKPVPGTMKLHAIVGGLELTNVYVANVSCYYPQCRTGDMCEHWKKVTISRCERKADEPSVQVQEPDEQTTAPTDIENECNEPNGEKSKSDNGKFNELDTSERSVQVQEPDEQTTASNDLEKDCKEPKGEESTSHNARFNELETSEQTSTKNESSNIDEYSKGDFVAAVYLNKWYVGEIVDKDESELEISFMKSNKFMTFQWPASKDEIWLKCEDILTKIGKPKPTGRTKRAFKFEEQELQLIQTFFDARNGSVKA
ncbi:hypothetical protein DPMN_065912 [Dreissena polymorpha]|uniref:Uncharacterized protein n=1 Tax=Dreissena polymorpha TaxID=45954 RepID=A0A9D3YWU2_DREPO|nr:hypothetical protein DPMN_065912 [Dreissena polymorpha]